MYREGSPSERFQRLLSDGKLHRSTSLEEAGITRAAMHRAVAAGDAVLYARGVFCSPETATAPGLGLAALSLRSPGLVVCMLSAARWHELSDEDPAEAWLALDRSQRRGRIAPSPYLPVRTLWWTGPEMRDGVDAVRIAGVDVRITSPARTVVDMVRHRDRIGDEPAMKTLHDYVRSGAPIGTVWDLAKGLGALSELEPFVRAAEEFSESIPVRGP